MVTAERPSRWRGGSSLPARLGLLVALAFLPLSAIVILHGQRHQQDHLAQLDRDAARLAQSVAGELEQLLETTRVVLLVTAKAPVLRSQDREACSSFLTEVALASPLYYALGAADSKGQWFCWSDQLEPGELNSWDQPWFAGAVGKAALHVAGYQVGRASGKPLLMLSQAFHAADGVLDGVVGLSIDLPALRALVEARGLPEGAQVTVADAAGRVLIALPEGQNLGSPVPDAWTKLLQAGSPPPQRERDAAGLDRALGHAAAEVDGQPALLVRVELAADQATRAQGLLGPWPWPTLALSLLLAIMTVWLGARASVRRPVEQLLAAATSWRAGDLQARARITTAATTEFRRLGATLDEMAAALDARDVALRGSEERFRRVVTTAAVPIMLHAEDGEVLAVSEGLLRLTGYTRAELATFSDWAARAYPDNVAAVEARIRHRFDGDEPITRAEMPVHTRSGEVRIWLWNAPPPERLPDGRKCIFAIGSDITELRRQEAARAASEERFRLAARASGGIVYDYDVTTGRVIQSEALRDLIGVDPEPDGREAGWWAARIHPEDRQRVKADAEGLLAGGTSHMSCEYRVRHEDGRWVHLLDRSYVVRDASGHVVRLVGVSTDISAQRQAEAALQASEARLRLALEAAQAGAWAWRVGEPRPEWTPENFALFGLPPEDGVPDLETLCALRVEPQDRELLLRQVRAALAGTLAEIAVAFRIQHPEDGVRWISMVGSIERDEAGCPLWLRGLNLDASVQKRTEEALRRSEQRASAQLAELEAIYEAAPVGLGLFDRQMRFVRVNRHLAEINGLPIEAQLGRVAWDVLPSLRKAAEPLFHRVFEAGEPITDVELEGETPLAPGVRRSWTEQLYPIKDETGTVIAVGAIVRETTAEKAAEAALRASEARRLQEVDRERGRLKLIIDNLSEAITAVLVDDETTLRNQAWLEFHGYSSWDELPGWQVADLGQIFEVRAPDGRLLPLDEVPMQRALKGESFRGLELRLRRRDTGLEWWGSYNGGALKDENGRVVAANISMRDITERKRAEERQSLLLHELSHRVKNLLAVVGAIARQTGYGIRSVDEFLESFQGRLRALGAAHELLTASAWRGVDLAQLIDLSLLPHAGEAGGRITVTSPPVLLEPMLAQTLALVLHELGTNALKHGALSVADGRVEVTGKLEPTSGGPSLDLVWRERGGPPVRPPTRTGFGTTMLTRALRAQHGGNVALDWAPEGLTCRIELPLKDPATAAG